MLILERRSLRVCWTLAQIQRRWPLFHKPDIDLLYCLSIKDKHGETALQLVPSGDDATRALFRSAQAGASVSRDDVASGKLLFNSS